MNEDKLMELREFYIFGEPVETKLGSVRFLTYKEYLMNIQELSIMKMNILHIYHQYRKMFDEKDIEAMDAVESIKNESLFNIVASSERFLDSYLKVFNLVFEDENMIAKVVSSPELFDEYRGLVLDMQVLQEDEVSPHPVIQEGIEMSMMTKSQKGDKQTFTDIVTSIIACTPNSFEAVGKMTVYQVYSIFYRINALKTYDTETLFATVSNEVKITPWSKNIDLFKNENESSMRRSDFLEKTSELF